VFLFRDDVELVVQCFRQRREQLWYKLASMPLPCIGYTDLGLSRIALMAGHTYLIEEGVQALYNGGDLLRQVAGVHLVKSSTRSELPAAMRANHCFMRVRVQASASEECGRKSEWNRGALVCFGALQGPYVLHKKAMLLNDGMRVCACLWSRLGQSVLVCHV